MRFSGQWYESLGRGFQGPSSHIGLPWWLDVKECNGEDLGLIPALGGYPGEGNATHSSILAWRIPWM